MRGKAKFAAIGVALLSVLISADECTDNSSAADKAERAATQAVTSQASVVVGTPAILNFTEKRQLKAIYELRDQANLVTYTYIVDMNGKRHKVCPSTSVGFGIPYSTEYTNPQYIADRTGSGYAILPQPDPNALYSPSAADATWVLCLHPQKKDIAPTYVESRISVYLFEMPAVD
jgi:hypothetical protein